jgi:hypothetical protein
MAQKLYTRRRKEEQNEDLTAAFAIYPSTWKYATSGCYPFH